MEDAKVLFDAGINSVYKGSQSLAHLFITDSDIILTKHSIWNLHSHASGSLFGHLDGEGNILFSKEKSKLQSITRTRFRLNGKCCLLKFNDGDELIVIFDFPAKTLKQIGPMLPGVTIDF